MVSGEGRGYILRQILGGENLLRNRFCEGGRRLFEIQAIQRHRVCFS